MDKDTSLNVLKQAILLERRGQAFYSKVADQADKPAVKQFFDTMADEEKRHIEILENQFKAYAESGRFAPVDDEPGKKQEFADKVITADLAQALSAASFEAAAIAAAMTLEKNAIRLYANRAEAAENSEEKALYAWLANWEKSHLDFLAEVERELTESVWFDNNFWPF